MISSFLTVLYRKNEYNAHCYMTETFRLDTFTNSLIYGNIVKVYTLKDGVLRNDDWIVFDYME